MITGVNYQDKISEFVVWAPLLGKISLKITAPLQRVVPMQRAQRGYWRVTLEGIGPETQYVYLLGGDRERPDPASHFQPGGVHQASRVVSHGEFAWSDSDWQGVALSEMIMYELHIGAFTPDGTFEAVVSRLDEIKETGINAIEIMPVAQFPGERNWGYDGVYPYAVQNSYGGPNGLKHLVNECHKRGMAVILDVVYNHLGPEGNYLRDFGPYFTDHYRTPWGEAINFDGPYSNEVRNYFIENAIFWFDYYHIDALRLDAVHGIYDMSAKHFLAELAERVEEYSSDRGRKYYLIAESDLNNSLMARPRDMGGYGVDALWCDDFHHSLHTLLSGERNGYYADFGQTRHFIKSLQEGFVYSGEFSEFRKKNHGNSSKDLPGDHFVVFSQNHDQVGNRMRGERLSSLVSFESLKLAAGAVLLSPYIPLLFMGEEYGETAPFLYFVSHSDRDLIEGIREGRKKEFERFGWKQGFHDPQGIGTYLESRLQWDRRHEGDHTVLLDLYRELIKLRREMKALSQLDKASCDVWEGEGGIVFMRRWAGDNHVMALFNFTRSDMETGPILRAGGWNKVMDSSDTIWQGPGALLPGQIKQDEGVKMRAESFALYQMRDPGGHKRIS